MAPILLSRGACALHLAGRLHLLRRHPSVPPGRPVVPIISHKRDYLRYVQDARCGEKGAGLDSAEKTGLNLSSSGTTAVLHAGRLHLHS